MAHVVTDLDTTASPDRVLRTLTDFSPSRSEMWPNIDKSCFSVESVGPATAEVTEGNHGIWERGRYDWSTPGTVHIDVLDSNAFKPGSYWNYTVTRSLNGGSHVHMEFDRRPRNFKGVILSGLLSLFGKQIYGKQLAETLHRLEGSTTKASSAT
jgi:hypothetical protein